VVAEAVEKIERFAHPDVRQEAKEALAESQRAFMASREADCRAEAAFMYLRTAKTRESFTISCLYSLTELRIARLKQRYLLYGGCERTICRARSRIRTGDGE